MTTDAPEFDRIYLQPECCAGDEGRLWCEDDDGPCPDTGAVWTPYIRADIAAAQIEALTKERDEQIAETRTLIRLGDKHREAMIAIQERETTLIKERDALRALLREAGGALRPFAREEGTWALSVKDRYRPGVTEPNYKQAHARAAFSIGDLRRARAVLTKLEALAAPEAAHDR